MKNLKKYGAAAAAGLVAATLIGGCGDTKEAPASEGSTKSGLTQYKPPKVDTKGLLSRRKTVPLKERAPQMEKESIPLFPLR